MYISTHIQYIQTIHICVGASKSVYLEKCAFKAFIVLANVLFNIHTPQIYIQYVYIYTTYIHIVHTHIHTQSHKFMRTTELVISACCMRNGLRVHRYRVFIS